MTTQSMRVLMASVLLTVGGIAPLHAQETDSATAAPRTSRWTPFLGCWSSSSAGAIGPMVCVVPTDSIDRVEFLTVAGDSIIGRTEVDASGRIFPYRRGACHGYERGRWSDDSARVFIKADYTCDKGPDQQSDAIIDLTRSDAFTYIEGDVGKSAGPARVINFIVQLDTLVFPAEVKRRLPAYRTLAFDASELEQAEPVKVSTMVDATSELSSGVVSAWLENRGESAVFLIADRRAQRNNTRMRSHVRSALRSSYWTRFGGDANSRFPLTGATWGVNWGAEAPPGYMLTPEMVGFGLPYIGYQGGFTWGGWR
jgi:hypothetical protein